MKMTLGRTDSGDLKINLPRLIETRMLIQANSGGGKSWCLRRVLEQTHGQAQQIIIDPEGETPSLREKFDYVYAARQGGDVLADPRSAHLLALRLLELGVSAIVDIYEMAPYERVRFVTAFLDAMVDAPKKLWNRHPVLVSLDEAHVYAPEHGKAESLHSVINAASRFRKRGFGLIVATQRLSKLHKDVAAEMNNKLVGRCTLDVDRKRAAEELGFTTREETLSLRNLHPGEFYAFGPALCEDVTRVKVGAVVTTHPKIGQGAPVVAPPREKVRRVLAQLQDLPKEAAEQAQTVEALKARTRTLEAELRHAKAAQPKPVAPLTPKRVEVPILSDQHVKALEKTVGPLQIAAGKIGEVTQALMVELRKAAAMPRQVVTQSPPAQHFAPRPRPAYTPDQPVARQLIGPGGPEAAPLGKAERQILAVLAQYQDSGRSAVQVAIQTGYSHKGGGYNNALSALKSRGLIQGPKERLLVTSAGAVAAGPTPPVMTGAALQEFWKAQLGKAERAILDALARSPHLRKEELATDAGYAASGGGFNNAISKLRTLELIKGRDVLELSEELR